MEEIVNTYQVEEKIIKVRDQRVILDSDVAELYGVETRRVNEAVKNNPNKFPVGYIIPLPIDEWLNLKSKISTSSWGCKNKIPNVFTERSIHACNNIKR